VCVCVCVCFGREGGEQSPARTSLLEGFFASIVAEGVEHSARRARVEAAHHPSAEPRPSILPHRRLVSSVASGHHLFVIPLSLYHVVCVYVYIYIQLSPGHGSSRRWTRRPRPGPSNPDLGGLSFALFLLPSPPSWRREVGEVERSGVVRDVRGECRGWQGWARARRRPSPPVRRLGALALACLYAARLRQPTSQPHTQREYTATAGTHSTSTTHRASELSPVRKASTLLSRSHPCACTGQYGGGVGSGSSSYTLS
jgi:hypothetical protein